MPPVRDWKPSDTHWVPPAGDWMHPGSDWVTSGTNWMHPRRDWDASAEDGMALVEHGAVPVGRRLRSVDVISRTSEKSYAGEK